MKLKLLFSLILCASLTCMAQGYKDGIDYYKVEQYDNAKELLLRNLDTPQTNKAEAYYYLGCIELANGTDAQAVKYFDQGVAANPEYGYNYVGLGQLELQNGKEKEAKKLFDDGKKLCGKKDDAIIVAIGRAYYDVDPVKYAKEIQNAIKDATKRNKQGVDVYVFQGDMEADQQKWGDAAAWYEMAMRANPDNIESYVKYANTYFHVNKAVAIQTLESLVASKPQSALAQREVAEKYFLDNQWTRAAEKYGVYMQNPNHFKQDESRYANLLFYGKRYQESYDLATKIISESQPGSTTAFYMKRMQLYNLVAMERWNDADALAKEFFAINPPSNAKFEVRDYTDYASVLKNLGDIDGAAQMQLKAYEVNPEKLDLLKDVSNIYWEGKDYANGVKYYQLYADTNPDVTATEKLNLARRYNTLGATTPDSVPTEAIVRQEALQKALDLAREVEALAPTQASIKDLIATIYMNMEAGFDRRHFAMDGLALEACDNLLAALDADPTNLTENRNSYIKAYSYKAVYALMAGDKENALKYFEKLYEVDPSNAGALDQIEKLKKELEK